MYYGVRKISQDGKITEKTFGDDLQAAAEYYFKERKPFEYGKNGGTIKLFKEETIFSCS